MKRTCVRHNIVGAQTPIPKLQNPGNTLGDTQALPYLRESIFRAFYVFFENFNFELQQKSMENPLNCLNHMKKWLKILSPKMLDIGVVSMMMVKNDCQKVSKVFKHVLEEF